MSHIVLRASARLAGDVIVLQRVDALSGKKHVDIVPHNFWNPKVKVSRRQSIVQYYRKGIGYHSGSFPAVSRSSVTLWHHTKR